MKSATSRLDLFSNYKRDPGNVDVLFNNVLSLFISRKFSCTFMLDIIYDHDVTSKIQVQQISKLGLRLKL